MRTKSSQRNGRWRVVVASAIVAVGVVVIPPSFDFDSDRDGVPDVTEVYERGTDPAEPDALYNQGLAETRVGKGR